MRSRPAVALLALVALGACTAPARGEPEAEKVVTLTAHWSRFSVTSSGQEGGDHVQVPVGTTVRFVVRNADPIAHELIVGDEEVQDRHEKGTEAHHGERAGEVSVPAGGTAETTYRFDRRGTVLFGCHLPGHWAYGMRGTIEVV
ncbi:MAG TPA: plastocyanin/azurin family copper-binding protein [Acidimicrobiales bacterium]|nr:plastocyanin/azurin family copper-binding protein [Acidimicrobiales bacterium]